MGKSTTKRRISFATAGLELSGAHRLPYDHQDINDHSLIQRARDHRTRSHTQILLFPPQEKWSPYRRRNISNIQICIDIRSTTCIPDILRILIGVLHSNI